MARINGGVEKDMDSEIIKRLKREIVSATLKTKEGHIPSGLSILDILWVLYDKVLDITPQNFGDLDRDHFILSKGHGALALYAVLAEKGFLRKDELSGFATYNSPLGGHPDSNKISGVEASTGSLGHGMPMALGMALGMRIRRIGHRVFVLIGDGECNEGSIWESALLASHHRLNNVTCIVDYNHSTDRALVLGDLAYKFESFGWRSVKVDGHDHRKLLDSFAVRDEKRPVAVVAETVKGNGITLMENNPAWHHRSPTKDELDAITKDLK